MQIDRQVTEPTWGCGPGWRQDQVIQVTGPSPGCTAVTPVTPIPTVIYSIVK